MAKPNITTRATKGSALTWTEGDTNLENLRDATITVKAGSGGTDVVSDLNGTVTLVAGSNISISGDNTAKTVTINASAGGITDVVQDTTPQLGGDLDVNGNSIVSTSNGNININPNGTGKIVLDGLNWPNTDGSANQVLKTDGAGNLSFATVSGGASTLNDLTDVNTTGAMNGHVLTYSSASSEWISQLPSSVSTLDDLSDVTISAASNGQLLRYNTSLSRWENATVSTGITSVSQDTAPQLGGDLELNGKKITDELGPGEILLHTNWIYFGKSTNTSQTNLRTNQSSFSIAADATNGGAALTLQRSSAGGNISLTPAGSGKVSISGNAFPTTTGTNGQVLTTNGAGTLSWATAGGSSSTTFALAVATSKITTPTAVATNLLYFNTEQYDGSNILTLNANGTFTISTAGTWLIEVTGMGATLDYIEWQLYNYTGSAQLISSFPPDNNTYVIPQLSYVHTTSGSNSYYVRQLTSSTINGGKIYLKITKLA